MALERSDVEKIAHLARLQIRDEEVPGYTQTLSDILALVDQLQATDTTDVEPMAHPLDAVQRLRADVVSETNQREQLQSVAPAVENGLFLVPRVIE
uniref:Asp-tRNA(Asn)/Glu-tRNA(Gln) amidotransferase subunit GatC n=1 Tax=Marinobacterium profundum TaxID=1714300 RepID=UPI00082A6C0E|nr:Asp-tRNA(Asn)/Glu-tRNA(Gln) amidotransferase subunit GatC [Marinobacterium profundum]